MTIDDLARMISRGFAAMAEGQDAIAAELRATRIQIAKIKGQRELDQERHEADLDALGTVVQEVDRRLRLVPTAPGAAIPAFQTGKDPAE